MEQGNYIYISDTYELNPSLVSGNPKYAEYLKNILVTNGGIKDRIRKLSENILSEFQGQELIFLCVLRGAFRFCKDLVDRIEEDSARYDISHCVEFIRARSYVNDTQEEVTIEGIDHLKLEGKNVIIVEDMVDRGKTLAKVSDLIRQKNPASLKIVVLAYKRNPENTFILPDFIGFSLPNEWIVGYNIDYNGHFRDFQHVAVLNDKGKDAFRINI
jgi:hypoxanthine phosphoribosyltransferase